MPDGSALQALADAQHRVRVSATVAGDGSSELAVRDGRDKRRLSAWPPTRRSLMAADSRMSAVLAVDGQAPFLALADSSGTERLRAAIRRESPVLQFFDHNRVARSGLAINDEAGLALMSDSTGASFPGVVLGSKDQRLLWSAPN